MKFVVCIEVLEKDVFLKLGLKFESKKGFLQLGLFRSLRNTLQQNLGTFTTDEEGGTKYPFF